MQKYYNATNVRRFFNNLHKKEQNKDTYNLLASQVRLPNASYFII